MVRPGHGGEEGSPEGITHTLSHQDSLCGKVAVHDHQGMAQSLTIRSGSIGKDTCLQVPEMLSVLRYRRFWNGCCRSPNLASLPHARPVSLLGFPIVIER